jgi:hypothetical protein
MSRRADLDDVYRDRLPAVDRHAQSGQDAPVTGVHALRAGAGELTGPRREDHPGSSECGNQFVQLGHRSTLRALVCGRVSV